jgi:hypothetical protein
MADCAEIRPVRIPSERLGEFLLGSIPASRILALPFLMPMYGCGALLVREVARRTGRGWPSIFAFAIRATSAPALQGHAPKPRLLGFASFLSTSVFFARPDTWLGLVIGIGIVTGGSGILWLWSRRADWGARQEFAAAAGALLTYCGVAFC